MQYREDMAQARQLFPFGQQVLTVQTLLPSYQMDQPYPTIKMLWDNPMEMMEKEPDKMIIDWR
jgi:hypothetical protein